MPRIIALVASLALVCATAPASAANGPDAKDNPRTQDFAIGPDSLTMPVPDGYCVPSGKLIGLAQATAAADTTNVTLATFLACGREGVNPFQDYVLLKVPVTALMVKIDKASALDQLEAAMTGPNAPKFDAAMEQRVEGSIGKVIGRKTNVQTNYGYMGRDGDCLYMGGRIQLSVENSAVTPNGANVACLTVAANKILTVYTYDFTPGFNFDVLKTRARAIALTIGAAPEAK